MRSLPLERAEVEQSALDAWALHVGRPVTDATTLREELSSGSLPEAFASTARRRPGALALTLGDGSVTHGELDVMAGRAGASLARLGVAAGSPVMLIAAVGVEEIAAYLGVLRLGGTVIPVSPSLTASEMRTMAAEGSAEVIVGSGPGLAAALASAPDGVREVACLRPADRGTGATMLDGISDDVRPVESVASDAVAILAFTSGSTGRPKPAPLSHTNLLASVRGIMAAWRWSEQDHLVHSLPISHQHGLSGVHATLLAGSRASLLGGFDAETTLRTVESGASIHFGVPTIHQRLLDTLGEQAQALGRLRLAVSGSGPLPPEVAADYLERTGQSLLERYGTTESGLNVSNPYEGDRVPGRVGLPLPGVELAVVDSTGAPVGDGETGEVMVRGPHVFPGYLGVAPGEQPFLGEWFRTGDLGAGDPQTGYLEIVGRAKDVIITGGMNVYPREVEDVLRSHPAVRDVVVVGVASPSWGEEVVALVVAPTVDPSGLARFTAERLASYKRPKRVLFVEEIPRNSVGKTQHDRLLQMVPPAEWEMPPDGIGSPPPL